MLVDNINILSKLYKSMEGNNKNISNGVMLNAYQTVLGKNLVIQ
jgi:hypothetical protein